jgi:uncharacterized membrane protein YgdD (TMEM256/DUF423 family)
MKWSSDYSKYKDLKDSAVALADSVGATGEDRAQVDSMSKEFENTGTASKMLMVAAALGIAGTILILKKMAIPAAAVLAVGALLPVIFNARTLLTTTFILVAAALAFLSSRKPAAAAPVLAAV